MTLTYTRSPTGTEHVNFAACPYCCGDIETQESFAEHYESCAANPEVGR